LELLRRSCGMFLFFYFLFQKHISWALNWIPTFLLLSTSLRKQVVYISNKILPLHYKYSVKRKSSFPEIAMSFINNWNMFLK
jgi:hypothetical protein